MNCSTRTMLLRWTAYLACGLAGLLFFFRAFFASGLDLVPGNIGDARFVLYVCEHWHRVFTGTASWRSPPILYPTPGVLGYSDALFALGAAHSALRNVGLDEFAAYQAVVLSLPLVGYVGAVWLLRRGFGFRPFSAVIGGLVFAFSSPLATSLAHAQLEAVAFVPYVTLALLHLVRKSSAPGLASAALPGVAFALLFSLLAYTAFYVAWYFVLLVCLCLLAAVPWAWARGRTDLLSLPRALARSWKGLALTAIALCVSSVPFVLTYAPVRRLFPARPFVEEVVPGLPTLLDLVNVGFRNALWGSALRRIGPGLELRPGFWELDKGITPVLLVAFLATSLSVLAGRRCPAETPARALVPERLLPLAVLACSAAVLIAWALMIRVGDRSLWSLVHRYFPGGGAIRSVFRFNIVLMLPIVIVVAHGLDLLLARVRAGVLPASLLAALMVLEQHGYPRDTLSKSLERESLRQVPAPPAACRTMAVTADEDVHDGWWAPLQLHAMLISQRFELPTVNGYSGWTPPGWDLHHPTAPDYRERLLRWAIGHGIVDGLCAYHVDTRTWGPFPVSAPGSAPQGDGGPGTAPAASAPDATQAQPTPERAGRP